VSGDRQVEKDLHSYNTLLNLWQAENPIKTIKLQFLLVTNALLIGFFQVCGTAMPERIADSSLLAIGGFVLNLIWTLSIGRTSLFQKAWKIKLDDIAQRYPDDGRFQILDLRQAETRAPNWLRLLGKISSKYYLLGTPIGFSIAWLCIYLLSK
jgi:hypothetical protein